MKREDLEYLIAEVKRRLEDLDLLEYQAEFFKI